MASTNPCDALATLLGADKVSIPGSAAYDATLSSYFALQASDIKPLCFVSPQTTGDVSTVIQWLTTNIDIRDSSIKVAIRSRGHLWVPGSSNSSGGVTIDLSRLESIHLSSDKSIVSIGVGATWDAVYAKLDPLGLSVAGGRVGGVGIGGLVLGGGISHLGPRCGWTCDTATAFEVVLADGSIVEAIEKENPDLFRGLKGGANNLGIVTRVDLKTFDQGLLWHGRIYSPLSTIDDHIKIFAKIVAAENYDENSSFICAFGYSQPKGITVINSELVYTKPVEEPPCYRELLSLPSIFKTTSTLSMEALAKQAAKLIPPGIARYMFATTTLVPTEAMLHAAFDAWKSSLDGVKDIKGLTWSLSLEPLPPGIHQHGSSSNAMGPSDRKGTRIVCLFTNAWEDEADDEHVYAATRALIASIEEAARNLGAYDPFIYLNYATHWQDPIASYGEESVKQLRELRARVDPKGVFTHLIPGGFKIPS
ncbi:putative oxidoreductase [Hypoxylon trugodes]|uniref:putative oxidoreductase n=1 Tax=Hypoxylon trugodes TaxID=326681 RepID=UPI0021960FFA|nr:putative oxidoreductase [Hypoxylon trugodes]KAI1384278.1 putative oxidoreductase [Hypoxylon trugodes]